MEADMKRGCPDCHVTILYNDFKSDLANEFAKLAERKGLAEDGYGCDYVWPWSLNQLLKTVNGIASIDSRKNHKGADLRWTVPQRHLVMILRDERNKLERAKVADREAERERNRNANR
jgi:hypothetical protein